MQKFSTKLRFRHLLRLAVVACSTCLLLGSEKAMANTAPSFDSGAAAHVTVCQDNTTFSATVSLNSILSITDPDVSDVEVWNILGGGTITANGSLSGFGGGSSTSSTGTSMPSSATLSYTSNAHYAGLDTFNIIVHDNHGGADTMTVYVTINAAAANPGTLSGPSSVFVGNTISYTGALSTGTWSNTTGNANVDPVTGVVTGVSVGSDVVSYTTTSTSCGSRTATYSVSVYGYPDISAFVPNAYGIPMQTITISGTNFNATTTNDIVYFGGVKANVTGATTTSLTVQVPFAAAYGPVSILDTVSHVQAYSANAFTPVYDTTAMLSPRISLAAKVMFSGPRNGYSVAFGDLDGDGKPEMVAVGNHMDSAMIFQNIGSAGRIDASSFAAPTYMAVKAGPTAVKLADMDGDGKLDIVTTAASHSCVTILRNTSTGTGSISFDPTSSNYWTTPSSPSDIAIADIDGDGRLDVVVACGQEPIAVVNNHLMVLKNLSSPGHINTSSYQPFYIDSAAANYHLFLSVAVGDINGDGKIDIVVSNHDDSSILIYQNLSPDPTTAPTLSSSVAFSSKYRISTAPAFPYQVVMGDIDGDGNVDLITNLSEFAASGASSSTFKKVAAYRNLHAATVGSGSFAAPVTFGTDIDPIGVAVGDLDGDGKLDVAVTNTFSGTVQVFKNNSTSGSINFSQVADSTIYGTGSGASGPFPIGVTIADIDGNGVQDLAVVSRNPAEITLFRNRPIPGDTAIIGVDSVCQFSSITITGGMPAGSRNHATEYWYATNGNATITMMGTSNDSAQVTGVTPGYDTIVSYVVAYSDTSHRDTFIVKINATVPPVATTGTNNVCVNAHDTLSNSTPFGMWISRNANATVSATGVVTGVTAGTDSIGYVINTPCLPHDTTWFAITIHPLPHAGTISPASPVSVSTVSSTSFSDAGASGTGSSWMLTNANANITSYTAGNPNVIGVTSSTSDTLLYIETNGCGADTARAYITICPPPTAGTVSTTHSSTYCIGNTANFDSSATATGGGHWVSTNHSIATIDPASGVATIVGSGTDTIRYVISTLCGADSSFMAITVTPNPNAGALSASPVSPICHGTGTTFTSTVGSGGSWSSLNSTVAAIGSTTGVVTTTAAFTNDTTTIIYTVTNVCGSAQATSLLTVNGLPNPGTVSGPGAPYCIGNHPNFDSSAAATPGGHWVSSNTAVATIDPASGVANILASGSTNIRYVVSTTCGSDSSSLSITVTANPTAGTISSTPASPICHGTGTTFSATGASGSGTWSSLNSTVASINAATGGVTTTAATTTDTTTIIYTVTNVCSSAQATSLLTVSGLADAGTISGADSVCVGSTIPMTTVGSTGAVTWTSTTSSAATVDGTTGVVTGVAGPGSSIIVAHITNSCNTDTAQHIVYVNALPDTGTISGSTSTLCVGATTTLTTTGAGGVWSGGSGNANVSDPSGAVTGANVGLAVISYTVGSAHCGSASAIYDMIIQDVPVVASISGSATVCAGAITTYTDATSGGTWTASNGHATVASTGVGTAAVHGISAIGAGSLDTIRYTVTNTCGPTSATKVVTVQPAPNAGIINGGLSDVHLCLGSTMTLTDSGAVFTSSTFAPTSSSVTSWIPITDTSLQVTADVGGTGSDAYVFTATNSCGSMPVTINVHVDSPVALTSITGPDTICLGATGIYHASGASAATAVWSTSPITAFTATVDVSDSIEADISSSDTGYFYVIYTGSNVCGPHSDSMMAFVNPPAPSAGTITGQNMICVGLTTQLFDTTAEVAGVWSSSDTTFASVNGTGLVTTHTAGTSIISYSVSNFCGTNAATDTVMVMPAPALAGTTAFTVCNNQAFTDSLESTVNPAAFTWIRPEVTGVSNPADTGATVTFSAALNDTTTAAVIVKYYVTVSAGGCMANDSVVYTVEPTPMLTSSTSDTLCSGKAFHYVPTSSTTGVNFTWTRPAVPGLSNAAGSGAGTINETLIDTVTTPLPAAVAATYTEVLTVAGTSCADTTAIHVLVDPTAPAPQITTYPATHDFCTNTYDMNFGAATVPPAGVTYSWTATTGIQVWATGNTQQYSLVSFTGEETGGWVYLNSSIGGFACPTRDSFAANVSSSISDLPEVIYFNNDFVCLRSDEDTYQWGYDDVSTLDSTIISGQTNQHYFLATPDLTHNLYWCITTHNGCMQKSYYNAPVGVQNVTASIGELKVYPNPASALVNIEITENTGGDYTVDLVNVTGQQVAHTTLVNNKGQLNVNDLASGIYLVDCYRNGVKVATAKFVKN